MDSTEDTIVAAKVVQNSQQKGSAVTVVSKKEMSTPVLAVSLVLVFLGLVGIIVLAEYLSRKYKNKINGV